MVEAVESHGDTGDTALGARPLRLWVEQLDDRSFFVRRHAFQRLVDSGKSARESLEKGLEHRSLEVRRACRRVLQEIAAAEFLRQLNRLDDPREPADQIRLPGWRRFISVVGDGRAARRLFARVAMRYRPLLEEIDAPNRSGPCVRLAAIEPSSVAVDDLEAWAMLLTSDLPEAGHDLIGFSSKVMLALLTDSRGPDLQVQSGEDAAAMRRMIGYWIDSHAKNGSSQDRLQIAMRYGCRRQANSICTTILDDRYAPAAAVATALLASVAMTDPGAETWLRQRTSDRRTCHIWQMISATHNTIRTRVSDVAYALLLREAGFDPRSVGFGLIEADSRLIFRDYSLGFPDDAAREAAYRQAMLHLQLSSDSS